MNTQVSFCRDSLLAKINGQLAFLKVALTALKQADIGEKVLTQMHRGVTAIRSSLRHADSPELEAFAYDFEDLLVLLCSGEMKLTSGMTEIVRSSTAALSQGVTAMQNGESVDDVLADVRNAVFSRLLDHAVTVKT